MKPPNIIFLNLCLGLFIKTEAKTKSRQEANAFLEQTQKHPRNRRSPKPANSFSEEWGQPSLERECHEEKCNAEECKETGQPDPEGYIQKLDDLCYHDPCYDLGTIRCEKSWNKRVCICKPGWTGDDCKVDINECKDNEDYIKGNATLGIVIDPLCLNGGTCKDTHATDLSPVGYICKCPLGWTGVNCEHDVNECLEAKVCPNNSICFNTLGSYSCVCSNGSKFRGQACSDNRACTIDPGRCGNEGVCIDIDDADHQMMVSEKNYYCICPGGFTGDHCEDDFNECSMNFCPEGTYCQEVENGFTCKCPRWGCQTLGEDGEKIIETLERYGKYLNFDYDSYGNDSYESYDDDDGEDDKFNENDDNG